MRRRKNPSKVDLRMKGISQDPVLEDQGRMTNIPELAEKLQTKYQTDSIIADLWVERIILTSSAKN